MNELPSLLEVLRGLAAGFWVPTIIAFLLEHIDAFQRLAPDTKKWAVLALFVALPLIATLLIQFVPPDVWMYLEPYWSALALGFVGWLGSQVAHAWDKRGCC